MHIEKVTVVPYIIYVTDSADAISRWDSLKLASVIIHNHTVSGTFLCSCTNFALFEVILAPQTEPLRTL